MNGSEAHNAVVQLVTMYSGILRDMEAAHALERASHEAEVKALRVRLEEHSERIRSLEMSDKLKAVAIEELQPQPHHGSSKKS